MMMISMMFMFMPNKEAEDLAKILTQRYSQNLGNQDEFILFRRVIGMLDNSILQQWKEQNKEQLIETKLHHLLKIRRVQIQVNNKSFFVPRMKVKLLRRNY